MQKNRNISATRSEHILQEMQKDRYSVPTEEEHLSDRCNKRGTFLDGNAKE